MRRPPKVQLYLGDTTLSPSKDLKYLGIVLDTHLTFGGHFRATTQKAERTVTALARLLPNVGGPGMNKRKALWGAACSILLYGAAVWANKLNCSSYRAMLESVQRKMMLRIYSAYRTVSTAALQVVAAGPSIHLLARERAKTFGRNYNERPMAKRVARGDHSGVERVLE